MYEFPADVDEIVRQRLASGRYASEDEVLRDALRALNEQDEDLAAVQEAIAELEAGDSGVPLDVAFERVRNRNRSGSGS